MSAHALVTGTLYRDPVMRTSKTGKDRLARSIQLQRPERYSAR